MRRRSSQGDSLEMFLDTICNTFGGILFILLFIVLQLRNVHDTVIASREEVSASEVATLQNEKERLTSELDSLQSSESAIDKVIDTVKVTPEAKELLEKLKIKTSQRDQIISENQTIEAKIDAILSQYVEGEDQEKLQDEIRTLEESLDKEKTANQELKEQKTKDVALPQLHASSKREIAIILRFGRLYTWELYDPNGKNLGIKNNDFTIIEEEEDSQVTVPNPWCGIDLYAEGSYEQIKQLFKRFDPKEHKIIVIVFPDSFVTFGFVRDYLKSQKFEITPWAFEEGKTIADRGGSGNKAQ